MQQNIVHNGVAVTYDRFAIGAGAIISFESLTANGSTTAVGTPTKDRTYQATVTGTGAVAATVQMQGSHDGTNWVNVGTAISLSGTGTATGGFASVELWPQIRYTLSGISGTGATVTASVAL